MKHFLICLLFVNFCFASYATPKWHKGSVVLSNDSVVAGDLSVDAKLQLVLVRNSNNTTSVYPGHKVKRVFFYDEKENMNRRFIAYSTGFERQSSWRLYEVVVSGQINVIRLRRGHPDKSEVTDRDDFDYFLLYKEKIYSFRQFNAKLIPTMVDSCQSLSDYMKAQKLSAFKDPDVIEIVQYYNTESEEQEHLTMQAR